MQTHSGIFLDRFSFLKWQGDRGFSGARGRQGDKGELGEPGPTGTPVSYYILQKYTRLVLQRK